MRPHRKRPSKRSREAAARTYLRAHLAWLKGFPLSAPARGDALPWATADGETISVDRERIRKASFAVKAAVGRFPRALERVVGDVERWSDVVTGKLAVLKACLHHERALPDLSGVLDNSGVRLAARSSVLDVSRRDAELAPLWVALGWTHWGSEKALASSVRVASQHAQSLRTILRQTQDLPLTFRCLEWVSDRGPQRWFQLLGDPRAWSVPLQDADLARRIAKTLHDARGGTDRTQPAVRNGFARPGAYLGLDLAQAVGRLPLHAPAIVDRQLRLLDLLAPVALLSAWSAWWDQIDLLERDARRLLASPLPQRQRRDQIRTLESTLAATTAPPRFRLIDHVGLVERIASEGGEEVCDALVEAVEQVSGFDRGRSLRATLLKEWCDPIVEGRQRARLARLIRAQADLLRSSSEAFHGWLCNQTWRLIETWWEDGTPIAALDPAKQALQRLIAHGREPVDWEILVFASRLHQDPAQVAALVTEHPDLSEEDWQALVRLSHGQVDRFRTLAVAWPRLRLSSCERKALQPLAERPALDAFLVDLFREARGRELRRLAGWSGLLRRLDRPGWEEWTQLADPERDPSAAIDLRGFPAELHEALARFGRVVPDAARAARRTLRGAFPLPERLEAEVATLQALLETSTAERRPTLEARLHNLRRRLEQPQPLSPNRTERLRHKLDRSARRWRWDVAVQNLRERVLRSLSARHSAPVPHEWLDDPDRVDVISSLGQLSPAFQALADRVLAERAGPPPWDFAGLTANADFLKRFEHQGYDPRPWLVGIGVRSATLPDGSTVSLALEADPLEVLRMGRPFQTCLSPGDFNYFSAVTNAIDVNKRVLYARDGRGKIVARCLLALSRTGALVSFRVYANEHSATLEAAIRAFVIELAAALGTTSAPQGEIETLVAHDWLDDGAIDLTGSLGFLKPGSAFSEVLTSVSPSGLIPALEAAIAPGPITLALLDAVIQHRALDARPELILPLLPLLSGLSPSPWTQVRIARLARRAGARSSAVATLNTLRRLRYVQAGCRSCLQTRVAREWVELGLPGRALRFLRATSTERSWEQEEESRIVVAADAHAALHQPSKALRLYRIAMRTGSIDTSEQVRALQQLLAS